MLDTECPVVLEVAASPPRPGMKVMFAVEDSLRSLGFGTGQTALGFHSKCRRDAKLINAVSLLMLSGIPVDLRERPCGAAQSPISRVGSHGGPHTTLGA